MKEERIKELYERYQLRVEVREGEEGITFWDNRDELADDPALIAEIRAAKPEIIAFIKNAKKVEKEIEEKEKADTDLLRCISKLSYKEIPKGLGTKINYNKDFNCYTDVSYNQEEMAILAEIAKKKMAKAQLQKEQIVNAKEEEIANVFAEAKRTGKDQLLEKYSEPCNDVNESCDIDIVCVYALSDGTKKTTRSHTC